MLYFAHRNKIDRIHQSSRPNQIYINGSICDNSVGSAFAIFENQTLVKKAKYKLYLMLNI
jgi:hypothetical protein